MPDAAGSAPGVLLTIAIPTYNRPAFLLDTIRCLLSQLTPACRLIIVDNASEPPAEDAIRDIGREFWAAGGQIARNPVNIGANANVLRCMEVCSSEWVWIVSDDDRIWENAVSTVLKDIAAHSQCAFLNFAQKSHPRDQSVLTRGRTDFLGVLKSDFYTLLFLTTTVYRISAIRKFILHGYTQIPSLAPHLAVMTMAVGDTDMVYFSEKTIVEYIPAREGGWSQFWVERGLPLLLDLPLSARDRGALRRALDARLRITGIFAAFIDTLGYGVRTHDPDVCGQLFRMSMLRRATVAVSVFEWMLIRILQLVLRAPRFAIRMTTTLYPVVKKQSFEGRAGCVGINLDDRV